MGKHSRLTIWVDIIDDNFCPDYLADVSTDCLGLDHSRGALQQENSCRGVWGGHHAGPALQVHPPLVQNYPLIDQSLIKPASGNLRLVNSKIV